MNIPNYENAQFVERTGYLTDYWQLILQNLISTLQAGIGQEGFQVSQVSSASNSVTPPTTGGQIAKLEAAAAAGGANAPVKGTIIFDPAEVNGGSGPAPNGQLKVLLADNVFHKITNT
jgi:hypothetical protein